MGHSRQFHLRDDYDNATGWLIGEETGACRHVRDDERGSVGVAVQGLRNPRSPIRTRWPTPANVAGRALSGPKAPDKPADPIIVHPTWPHAADDSRLQRGGAGRWCCGPR